MPTPRRPQKHRTAPDPLALAVGRRVKKLRLERDFTFDAFVEETGLGRGYISELERGLVVPSLHALAKLATALELTVADLVLGETRREALFEATLGLTGAQLKELEERVAGMRAPPGAPSAPSPASPRGGAKPGAGQPRKPASGQRPVRTLRKRS